MNKIMLSMLVVLFVTMFSAVAGVPVGSPDQECMANGFDFGIAKFEWSGTAYVIADNITGYALTASGNATNASWTSSPAIAGVVMKSGLNVAVFPGGLSGDVYGLPKDGTHPQVQDISHFTLCGNNNAIPEFGTVAALVALAGAVSAFVIMKRD
jgi:hypothetical protein